MHQGWNSKSMARVPEVAREKLIEYKCIIDKNIMIIYCLFNINYIIFFKMTL